jgi:hypothetical protein
VTLEEYYCGGRSSGGKGMAGQQQQLPPIIAVGTPGGQHIKVRPCCWYSTRVRARAQTIACQVKQDQIGMPACAYHTEHTQPPFPRQSHHNYGILALAAEKVTGQDIHDLIHRRVLAPLGMTNTDLIHPSGRGDRVGDSFKWSAKAGFKPIPQGGRFDASHGRPRAVGGSAYSTAADMAKCVRVCMCV